MANRPLSLTIIGWFLIISGLFGLYGALNIRSNEIAMRMIEDMGMSVGLQQAVSVFGALIALACAYGIFKGQPWSRVLYVGWAVISLAIGFATSPMRGVILLSFLFVAVVAFFLFRPAADEWFRAKGLQLQRSGD